MVLLPHQLELMVFIPTPTAMTDHLKNSVTSNHNLPYPLSSYALALKIPSQRPILFSCSVHIFIYLGVLENTIQSLESML